MALAEFNQQAAERVVDASSQFGPSTEEQNLIRRVTEFMERSKRASDDQRQDWYDNYRFVVDGRQWPVERPSWRFSEVVNLTLAAILQEIGIQTDSRPKTEYLATEPSDVEFANTLKIVNDLNWSKPRSQGYGWLQKTTEILMDCKLADLGVAEVYWDTALENGLGDIGYRRLRPEGCFWDPKATDLRESRWFIYAEPVPTSTLRQKHPDKKHRIKPDVQTLDSSDRNTRISVDTDRFRLGGTLGTATGRLYSLTEEFGGEEMTLLIRCWLKDEELEQVKLDEPDSDGNQFVMKKRFPKGRYIELASNTVLRDGPNGIDVNGDWVEYEDGEFPIAILKNYAVPGKFEGLNEVTHLRGPQTIYNYTWSHILDQMRMGSNPQHVVQAGAVDNPEDITNEPGLIIETNDIGGYRREPGVGVSAGMFNILDAARSSHDTVQGLTETARGVPLPNVTSGLQLEGFVEAAQTRPRLKNRNLDDFLQRVAQLMLSRYLQFYTQPRVFRITNQEGFPEFVEFFVEETEEGKVARVRNTVNRDGRLLDAGSKTIPVKGVPDVKSVSGSALPFAKAQKSAQAISLFQSGAIDQEALLDSIDWPKAEEVLQRMKEAVQAQQGVPGGGQEG